MRRHVLVLSLAAVAMIGIAAAAPQAPKEGGAPAPAAAPKPADLSGLAFLAGRWSHRDSEGLTEEHWSGAAGNNIMGMFRWCGPDGAPMMFEILTITAEAEGTLLRLRHFTPTLGAKEEKDAPKTLKLDKLEAGRASFVAHANAGMLARVTYHSPTKNTLEIEVAFTEESRRPALKFALAREGAGK